MVSGKTIEIIWISQYFVEYVVLHMILSSMTPLKS